MLLAVNNGRSGTAMQSFANVLSADDIELVVDFIRREFMRDKAVNTSYHTVENGWPDHERYREAFPFALGEIPLDSAWSKLTKAQQFGKRLFLSSCVTCHDRARVSDEGAIWEAQVVSFPRNQYAPGDSNVSSVDSMSQASPFAMHDVAPVVANLTADEKSGEQLFQKNCAFCHAADGTGKNWIGTFLQPHPRNLTDSTAMQHMTKDRLRQVIREGLSNSTMSAWKHVLSDEQIRQIIAYIDRAFYRLRQ